MIMGTSKCRMAVALFTVPYTRVASAAAVGVSLANLHSIFLRFVIVQLTKSSVNTEPSIRQLVRRFATLVN